MNGILNPKFNEMAFLPDEVAAGMVSEFIQFLLNKDVKYTKLCRKHGQEPDKYTEFHIMSDGYAVIVQWRDVFIDLEAPWFEFVDEGEMVCKVLRLPDNTEKLCYDQEEADETLKIWLEAHPDYKQDENGRWYNEDEYRGLEDYN